MANQDQLYHLHFTVRQDATTKVLEPVLLPRTLRIAIKTTWINLKLLAHYAIKQRKNLFQTLITNIAFMTIALGKEAKI